ncbi:BQ5605_C026g10165 [Microbotryum silenes-dioicae]|uniref:BQ5605_C026g10165 protein n=1 Tax=Microbotryum silenes-dioicae TaxID=796604 RepID=A0A2X0MRD4_9BASI|nr:BQ5605_C026g10165 [Microbotryum silenes-dioicae]
MKLSTLILTLLVGSSIAVAAPAPLIDGGDAISSVAADSARQMDNVVQQKNCLLSKTTIFPVGF